MNQEDYILITLFIAIIGIFLFALFRGRKVPQINERIADNNDRIAANQERSLALQERQIAAIERIAIALEKREK